MRNIYIIGGGPGDPDLISLKAKKIIEKSDYIFMSQRYLNGAMFENIKEDCRLLDSFDYSYDEKLDFAKKAVGNNKIVSFITMGDPALYGMVGGLVDRFEKNFLDFEIIPGINAALASSASLKRGFTGLGLTNTSVCTSFNNVEESKDQLEKIAALDCSVSIFMGLENLKDIVQIFLKHRRADTPMAIVSNASWDNEEVLLGNLSNIMEKFEIGERKNSLILIGDFLTAEYDYDLEKRFMEMKKKSARNK
ncbi:MAG: SAM-dependent methyltransferase [Bacillota bacterium]|nr:SAM-dependent methyltransferase [Bacillota bacterium]